MVSSTTDNALRLLEAIFLLLPIVAILLQVMFRFYVNDDGTDTWDRSKALFTAIGGYILLVASASGVILVLAQEGMSLALITAATGALLGLVALGFAAYFVINHMMSQTQEPPKQERNYNSEPNPLEDGGKHE